MVAQLTMNMRPATIDDLAWIKSCAERAYEIYVPRIGRKPAPVTADFATRIDNNILHLGLKAQARYGFIICYGCEEYFHIENVALAPEFQGQGLGRKLIEWAEAKARNEGFTCLELYTNEMMTENISYYPKLGYEETDRRTEDGFNRVYFTKIL